ncbi:MAG: M81 family metallopeptidase [Erysipelotrichaceae bacterium]|nr:M81 family metallopeptidase [Erysipelotrichaceae bacterium]
MKILIGGFIAESNAYTPQPCEIQHFTILTGEAIAKRLYVEEIAKEEGIELIPAYFASGAGAGRVAYDTFDYIQKQFLHAVKKHQHEIDGMFFFFHGASNVIDLEGGSGDHSLVREIRKVVGPYVPLAMVMDPHGNLSQEQADNCNIIRTFRHSPHTDRKEAHQIVFRCLVDLLKERREIHPVYRKVPILLGGERCVSTDEPLVSINCLLNEIEADPRIMCCSYHIGYLRHDSDKCGASVIVVPYRSEDKEYAEKKADEIYNYVWERRREFHFTGYADEPDAALEAMLKHEGCPCFLTDSGDNVTAGASGCNTYVLRQVLNLKDFHGKNILFAEITDKKLCDQYFFDKNINDHVEFEIGAEIDHLSSKVSLKGTIISKGELHNHYHDATVVGTGWTVKLDNFPVTVIVGNYPISFAERIQYQWANVEMDQYDLIIVKQGYLYPELKAMASHYVMSLTDGACMQRTERLVYKKVQRPIYPLDNI